MTASRSFNPRPGTSPGRSIDVAGKAPVAVVSILGRGQAPAALNFLAGDAVELGVSILGRGQAPAAQGAYTALRAERQVSILGRGQAPAARDRLHGWAHGALFQSSAGDKPRPLFVSMIVTIRSVMFQSSAGDKPRPLIVPGALGDVDQFVSILGRGQAPAAPAKLAAKYLAMVFQSSAGDKPRPLDLAAVIRAAGRPFQSSAGDKPRPLPLQERV